MCLEELLQAGPQSLIGLQFARAAGLAQHPDQPEVGLIPHTHRADVPHRGIIRDADPAHLPN